MGEGRSGLLPRPIVAIYKHFLVVELVETLASVFSCSQAESTPAWLSSLSRHTCHASRTQTVSPRQEDVCLENERAVMPQEVNMSPQSRKDDIGITTVQTFADGLIRDRSIVVDNNNSAATRLVWFVAIAGFGLLNVDNLAEAIVGISLTKSQLVLLVLPWALVGLSGVIAHWNLGELGAKDNEYYMMKQHSVRAWLAAAPKNPKINDVLDILNVDETDTEVSSRKKVVEKLAPTASWWEKVTFIFLIISFVWSVLYPLALSYE